MFVMDLTLILIVLSYLIFIDKPTRPSGRNVYTVYIVTTLVVVTTDGILAFQHVEGLYPSSCSTSSLGNVKPDVLCIKFTYFYASLKCRNICIFVQ